jgi:GDSL-like Lipase/Acylhydrolase family
MSSVTPANATASPPRRPSIARRLAFTFAAVALCCAVAGVALLAVDLYLHARFHERGGFNRWGYRGVVRGSKRPRELRLAFLGGSTAFGYGVSWRETIPFYLEHALRARMPGREVSVVNLGFPNDGAFATRFTLEDYRYLRADIVCLYDGYNDLMGDPTAPYINVFRRASPVFRLTGYMPIFPVVFREKASALLYGDTNAIYARERKEAAAVTTFRPNVASRASAQALNAAASISESLERQLGKLSPPPPSHVDPPEPNGCAQPWTHYCRGVFDAVDYAIAGSQQVIVISQPYLLGKARARHQWQQRTMSAALAQRYRSDPRVRYVDAGPSVDVADPRFGYDGMHLTAEGNQRVATFLLEPVLALVGSMP